MKFKNPTFKEGLNLTIRRGVKSDYKPGDMIFLMDAEKNRIGKALIKYVQVTRFKDIHPDDLKFHHLGITDWTKMFMHLHELYEEFNAVEIVTSIFFDDINIDTIKASQ